MVSAGSIIGGSVAFVRNNPALVAVWTLVYIAGGLLISLTTRPLFEAQMAMAGGPAQLAPGFLGTFALVYVGTIIMFLTLFAAVFRAVLQPERSRAAYLRFGLDELRLLGLMVILGVGLIVVTIVAGIVMGVVAAILAVLVVNGGEGAIMALILLIYLSIIGTATWLTVRISTAAPLTILRGRIIIGDAWRLTRGYFWTLFGGYFVILLMIAIAFTLFFTLTMGSYLATVFGAMNDPVAIGNAMRAQMELVTIGSPLWFVMLIGGGALGGISIALQGAMTAIATRDLLAEVATSQP